MNRLHATLADQLGVKTCGCVGERLPVQDHRATQLTRVADLGEWRDGRHDDDAFDTEPRRVMRNTLRVVAGRHRGDAGSAFGVAEAHQLVERTTLLERRGELEILEFDPDLGTGDLRQHTRMRARRADQRSEEHTSELQSLMRISYAVFCLKKK